MRLGIFGDSHFASIKHAYDMNAVELSGIDVEFWGHAGGTFRSLYFGDGSIRSKHEWAAAKYATVNKYGRTDFPVSSFDVMLFYGVRTDVFHIFSMLSHWRKNKDFISTGLTHRVIKDHLKKFVGYKIATAAAAERKAKIILMPKPFFVEGATYKPHWLLPDFDTLTAEDRRYIWDKIVSATHSDDVHVIPQDERTIHAGLKTHPRYAIDDYIKKNDFAHMNAEFGAIALTNAVALARSLVA